MATINLSRLAERYVITGYEPNYESKVWFTFSEDENGRLKIGDSTFPVKKGVSVIEISALSGGVYVPELMLATETLKLDPIKVEAGIVAPHFDQTKKLIELQIQLYKLSDKSAELSSLISEISSSVYATIF
jgi:hypothetical protein